jgi:cystathionine beta-lyase/cystathionine gamma-synthase
MARKQGIGTILVHGAHGVAPSRPVTESIVRSVTYHFDTAAESEQYYHAEDPPYLYSRYENPTVRGAEAIIAAAEGAEDCALFASGMAAATTALLTFGRGGEVVATPYIYGGVYRFLRDEAPRLGLSVKFADAAEIISGAALSTATRVVWFETPANPTIRLLDIAAISSAARSRGTLSIVDSTFASPILQKPLTLGTDLVFHSATKYLNGHSDVLAGAVVGDAVRIRELSLMRRIYGGNLDAGAAYELIRGMKTLEVRVRRQCETALELARRLSRDRRVERVLYPALGDDPDHPLTQQQMPDGCGGVFSFVVPGGLPGASRVYDRLQLVARAASLGSVESLVSLPLLSSHHGFSDAELARAGVDKGMLRVSVGLESVEDLWEDLDRALS